LDTAGYVFGHLTGLRPPSQPSPANRRGEALARTGRSIKIWAASNIRCRFLVSRTSGMVPWVPL